MEGERVTRRWINFNKESIHRTTNNMTKKTGSKHHKDWMNNDISKRIEERNKLKENLKAVECNKKAKNQKSKVPGSRKRKMVQ